MPVSDQVNEIPAWFQSEMECLFALYPAATLSVATKIAWWSVLGRLDRGSFRAAASRACQKSPTFIPSAFAVLGAASSDPSIEQRAALMWPAVVKASGGVGNGELDEIGKEVFRQMGGRQRLGQMDAQEFQTWGKKEFERLYAMISEQRDIERDQLGAGADVLQLKAVSR